LDARPESLVKLPARASHKRLSVREIREIAHAKGQRLLLGLDARSGEE
jgi:hypothetical protein